MGGCFAERIAWFVNQYGICGHQDGAATVLPDERDAQVLADFARKVINDFIVSWHGRVEALRRVEPP